MLKVSLGVYFRQWLGFTSKSYTVHLSNFSQTQQFADIGAHHHNGVVEKAIQTINSIARTLILQSAIHWPKSLTPPFGPWQSSMPPISTTRFQIPTQVSVQMISSPRQDGSNLHVWGCPRYVLDKKISDGKKLPHWKPRAS